MHLDLAIYFRFDRLILVAVQKGRHVVTKILYLNGFSSVVVLHIPFLENDMAVVW